ncbi:MAG: hypothetical protein AAFO84_11140 [Cyanobacteria bacterium J06598_1]
MTSHPSASSNSRLFPLAVEHVLHRIKPVLGLTLGATAIAWTITGPVKAQTATPSAQISQAATAVTPPVEPTPKPTPFAPNIAGVLDLSTQPEADLGIGHLRPQASSVAPIAPVPQIEKTEDTTEATEERQTVDESENAATTPATNGVSWLSNIILPLYTAPGGDHWGWIYQGWLIPDGQTYLAIGRDAGFAMVKSEEDLYTFPVLETRDDGWFRVQYTTGGSAWAHTSQLSLGETPLVIEDWEDTLASQSAVYFLEGEGQPLRSRPEVANNMLSLVPNDSLIEPLDFAGDWMRVRITRPVAECTPLTGATVTEGWMRWRTEESAPLVWYKSDGDC